jgi:hypothetical protein
MFNMMSGKVLLVANTDWYLFNFRLDFAQFLKSQGLDVVMVSPGLLSRIIILALIILS